MEALNLTKNKSPQVKILSGHQLLVIEYKSLQNNFFPGHLSAVKSIQKLNKIFQKTNISYPMIRSLENLECFVFLLTPS